MDAQVAFVFADGEMNSLLPILGLSFLPLLIAFVVHGPFSYKDTRPRRRGQPLRSTPNTLPIIHNGWNFLRPRHQLFGWFTRCIQLHGHETLRIQVPFLPEGALVSNPDCLKFIFNHEDIFQKGSFFKDRSKDLFGDGIINTDGLGWQVQRKAGQRFFSKKRMTVLREEMLPMILRDQCQMLEGVADKGQSVDLQTVVHEITTRIMGQMAYGQEMHADDDFTRAFEYASGKTAERFQNPLWRITELFLGAKMRKCIRTVKQYGRELVAKAQSKKDVAEEDASESLIDVLLRACSSESEPVADAALNFLSAGRDTVAQALTWTFYLLIKNPEITSKLRKGTPVFRKAVLYESLRLFPPIPFEIKQVQADTRLPDDTELPAWSIVVWCPWAMNRAPYTWGDDAGLFRPERWIDDDGGFVPRTQAEFPAFNGGKRLCLGVEMAEIIGDMVIECFVERFDFGAAFPVEVERITGSSLTLPMEGGLPVYVYPRSDCRVV